MSAQVIQLLALQHNNSILHKRDAELMYCSFCGKSNEEVKRLVRNEKQDKLICDECIGKARILAR